MRADVDCRAFPQNQLTTRRWIACMNSRLFAGPVKQVASMSTSFSSSSMAFRRPTWNPRCRQPRGDITHPPIPPRKGLVPDRAAGHFLRQGLPTITVDVCRWGKVSTIRRIRVLWCLGTRLGILYRGFRIADGWTFFVRPYINMAILAVSIRLGAGSESLTCYNVGCLSGRLLYEYKSRPCQTIQY